MEVSAEDPSKKRDSAQVEHGEEEKSKKVRVFRPERHRSPTRRVVLREPRHRETQPKNSSSPRQAPPVASNDSRKATGGGREEATSTLPTIWDLESALLNTVRFEGSSKELLLKDEDASPWITFSVGHAGDASTIAHWYRQSNANENPEVEIAQPADATESPPDDDSRSSMLEVWLADGLGDEDTPPAVHALLSHVNRNDDEKVISALSGVTLLTLDWDEGERILRVQWMHIDSSLERNIAEKLEQRTWLRIAVLARMTAAQVVTADKKLTLASLDAKISEKERPSPSAE